MLASEPASWQRQEQSPELDRAHRRLGTADRVAHGSDELVRVPVIVIGHSGRR